MNGEVRMLEGRIIGLSMSPPADLGRLGYPDREFDRLVFELAMRIIRAGGRVLYGGHLHEGSLTVKMFEHLATAYASHRDLPRSRRVRPFLHMLAHDELRKTRFARLVGLLRSFRALAETRVVVTPETYQHLTVRHVKLEETGVPDAAGAGDGAVAGAELPETYCLEMTGVPGGETRTLRGQADLDAYFVEVGPISTPDALTNLRDALARMAEARVVLGGRRGDRGVAGGRDLFSGRRPGIHEEVIKTLFAGKPIAILAAYGGAGRDAAIDLGLLPESAQTPYLGEPMEGVEEARSALRAMRPRLDPVRTDALAAFARSDDAEMLAFDVVHWLAHTLRASEG